MRTVLMLLLLTSCTKKTAPPLAEAGVDLSDGPSPAVAGTDKDFGDSHMSSHHTLLTAARDGLIRGDLEAVREPMSWLADHERHSIIPDSGEGFFQAMKATAAKTRDAKTVAEAATGVATVASECGACHGALNVGPKYPEEQPPDDRAGVGWHMARHRWAADRMWEGMISPSDTLWNLGVVGLQEDPLTQEELHAGLNMSEDEKKVAEWLHELGDFGAKMDDAKSRASLYGELLTACSDCHAKMRK